jgi:hypothetical protein
MASHFFTLAHNGAAALMFLLEWREFPSAPYLCKKKKLDGSSRLNVAEIARFA